MVYKSSKIIRQLAGPNLVIFNDKLVSGTRSYKVGNWRKSHYEAAQRALTAVGINSTIKFTNRYNQFRLHVN